VSRNFVKNFFANWTLNNANILGEEPNIMASSNPMNRVNKIQQKHPASTIKNSYNLVKNLLLAMFSIATNFQCFHSPNSFDGLS